MGSFLGSTFVKSTNPKAVAECVIRLTPAEITDEQVAKVQKAWAKIKIPVSEEWARAALERDMTGKGKPFFVSPSLNGWVGIFTEYSSGDEAGFLAEQLSRSLDTEAINFVITDSDFLRYSLYSKSGILDSYLTPGDDDGLLLKNDVGCWTLPFSCTMIESSFRNRSDGYDARCFELESSFH